MAHKESWIGIQLPEAFLASTRHSVIYQDYAMQTNSAVGTDMQLRNSRWERICKEFRWLNTAVLIEFAQFTGRIG